MVSLFEMGRSAKDSNVTDIIGEQLTNVKLTVDNVTGGVGSKRFNIELNGDLLSVGVKSSKLELNSDNVAVMMVLMQNLLM